MMRNAHVKEALQTYEKQIRAGHKPTIPTLVSALKACTLSADLQTGMQILATLNSPTNLVLANSLIDMLSKLSSIVEALRIFNKMPQHTIISWTSIILGYATKGQADLALQLFASMQSKQGCTPDAQLYVAALKACSSLAQDEKRRDFALRTGKTLHSNLIASGHESNLYVANTLLDMYTKCRSLGSAQELFERMKHRDVVTWSSIITGYVHVGEGDAALSLFSRMQDEGCSPDAGVFISALKACGSLAEEENGTLVNGQVVKTVIFESVGKLHRQLADSGYEHDTSVMNTLVDVYGKCGAIQEARTVFERIPRCTVVSWSGMITGYSNNDESEEALEVFSRMKNRGFAADARVLMAVLKACGSLVRVEEGRSVHCEIYKSSMESDILLVNSLVSFYGKCGRMNQATHVFDSASFPDTVSWTSLIAGYSQQGETNKVFELFNMMHREHVLPNSVTFLLVLTSCSHAGRVENARLYFEAMSSLFSITPSVEHYVCMADVLARGNKLEEAVNLILTMPYEPSLLAWRTVLAAARKWNNLDVGKLAFESVLRIDERDEAPYTLMENLYAGRELWEEAGKVAERRKRQCVHGKLNVP